MLEQVYNGTQLATLPADKTIDLSKTGDAWFHLINLSPHCFEIWDERGLIRDVCREWSEAFVAIGKASGIEGVIIHGLATLGLAPDAGALKVLYEVVTSPPAPGANGAPPFVEINGANKSALLTVVNVTFAATVQIDTGLASRKSVRVTSSASNANKIALGYLNTLTAADPPAAATDGVILPPGNSMTFGVGPTIKLFGRAMVADTKVTVEELA